MSDSRSNCVAYLEYGLERTSATTWTAWSASSSRKCSMEWLEWPMVSTRGQSRACCSVGGTTPSYDIDTASAGGRDAALRFRKDSAMWHYGFVKIRAIEPPRIKI